MNWQKILFGRDFKNKKEFFFFVAKATIFVVCFKSFVYANYKIPSSSMVPTLLTGDMILVNKYHYGYSRYSMPINIFNVKGRFLGKRVPQYGDVIVFKCMNKDALCVKRLIGLPGDKVEIKRGRVIINDVMLQRRLVDGLMPWSPENENTFAVKKYIETDLNGHEYEIILGSDISAANNAGSYVIPAGFYFALGDNRDNSHDSRFPTMGFVPEENIVGLARFVYFSASESVFKFWRLHKTIRFDRIFKRIL